MGVPLGVVLGPEADGCEQGVRRKGTRKPACPAARRPWSRRGSGRGARGGQLEPLPHPLYLSSPALDSPQLGPRLLHEGPFLKVHFCPVQMGVPLQIDELASTSLGVEQSAPSGHQPSQPSHGPPAPGALFTPGRWGPKDHAPFPTQLGLEGTSSSSK